MVSVGVKRDYGPPNFKGVLREACEMFTVIRDYVFEAFVHVDNSSLFNYVTGARPILTIYVSL